jgi:predicted MPP superfamily phosphohydrolase
MRLAWLTDIHLNFLDDDERRQFIETMAGQADAFAISGDIGESPKIIGYLKEMEEILRKPIYFVLGNHDFYRGSIANTRDEVARLAEQSEFLVYMTATTVVTLSPKTALVGHDGWADARLGDFETSDVFLNDYVAIQELRKWKGEFALDKPALGEVLNVLGDEAARHLEAGLTQAVADHSSVIALTHVPPFKEAAWHEGKHSDDNYLPHFACKATGDVFRRVMNAQPQSSLLVLCGHTHGQGEVQITENLQVLTGEAEYGHPLIQQILDIE